MTLGDDAVDAHHVIGDADPTLWTPSPDQLDFDGHPAYHTAHDPPPRAVPFEDYLDDRDRY